MTPRPRALFFGTPQFAVPTLEALAEVADVRLVVSQPDRPKGRGLEVAHTPVKARALELGLAVHQPEKVRTPELAHLLASHDADIALVVAYGRILTPAILATTRKGFLNVHASILPRWRGAAPIQWALIEGDACTGVAMMQLDEGMDTGPVFGVRETKIASDDTTLSLGQRLSQMGAQMVREMVPQILAGAIQAKAQPADGVTHARPLEKRDGALDFRESATRVRNRARGVTPWPGAHAYFEGAPIKLGFITVVDGSDSAAPGTIVQFGQTARIACGSGVIEVETLQPEGKRAMAAGDFLRGRRLASGARFDLAIPRSP